MNDASENTMKKQNKTREKKQEPEGNFSDS